MMVLSSARKALAEVDVLTGFGKGGRAAINRMSRRSGPARVIVCSVVDLGCGHLPRDVSHLLADAVGNQAN
jgi:pyrimidine operon attenuation protein/uracil phosphoribosyltransferase